MKKTLTFIGIVFLPLLINSCEESFSPKADFVEKYTLYCIMNVDSSKQTAVLLKSYDVEGFDPYTNTESSFISGADIRIRQKDRVFFMKDTSAIIENNSRYPEPINFYYVENFLSVGNDSIEIVATLPSGKKLYGISKAPNGVNFDPASDRNLPPEEKNIFTFSWESPESSRWYLPKLEFYYIKDGITRTKVIPVTYEPENGSVKPVYPVISNNNYVNFTSSALDSAFIQISQGDPNKSSYKILGAVLSLLIFDEPLSNYYSTTNGFLDDFTVVLDATDYTNIKGGLGIIGLYKQQRTGAIFKEEYIQSFGYTPGLN
jgi:hypothetical protein